MEAPTRILELGGRCLFLVVLLLGLIPRVDAAWYSPSWPYRKQLTINGGLVPAAQANFPVLVAWTSDAALAASAQANGNDILFTAADGSTKLDHEIESYTSATGALAAWVRIPALASGPNTTIYMYYGNGAAASQQNRPAVWDANFQGVWHLVESPANGVAGHIDSTANGFTGTPQGFADGTPGSTNAVGVVSGADLFLTDTYNVPAGNLVNNVEVPDNVALRPNGDFTVEAWANLLSPASGQFLVYKLALTNFAYQLLVGTGTRAAFQRFDTGATGPLVSGTTVLQANTWYHIVGVKSGGNLQIYVNGSLENTVGGVTGNIYSSNPQELVIGATYWGAGGLNGREDEVRFSNVARSQSWIQTEYNNLTNQGVGAGKFILGTTPETLPTASVYYSVGTSLADLKAGAPTIDITAGAVSFSLAQPDNVGVGDEITYNGSTRAYISGRTSATQYSVTTATGTLPLDVTGAPVNQIKRAFNSLSAAAAGSSDLNHLNTMDLVAGGIQLNWACYNDAPLNDLATVSGAWITGPVSYIRIFTPTAASQVGVSQRHRGKAATGFRMAPVNAAVAGYSILNLQTGYVRIEGLEIDGSGLTNATALRGIYLLDGMSNVGDVRIDSSIIHDIHTTGAGTNYESTGAIFDFQQTANSGPPLRISNNIIYGVTSTVFADNHHISGIHIGSRTTSYVYNNTIYNIYNQGGGNPSGAARGIIAKGWPLATGNATVIATNNYVGDVRADWDPSFACYITEQNGILTRSYDVSSDATAGACAGCQNNRAAYATYFVNTTVGSEDLHLLNSSLTLWNSSGTSLGADPNLPVTTDIDGVGRIRPDIGADEFSATVLYRSVGNNGGAALANGGGTNALTISGSTATFGSGLPNNVGVGDVLQYNSNGALAFVHARSSSQVFTVKDKSGNPPTPVAGDTGWFVYRAYRSLSNWESQTENASIVLALRDFDVPAGLNLRTSNTIMTVACYRDAIDTTAVQISGWTTDATHYISIFAPYLAGHVGVRQRHGGTWASGGYALVADVAFLGVLDIRDNFVRVTGLRIENTHAEPAGGADQVIGIQSRSSGSPFEVQLSNNIIRATGSVALSPHDWRDTGLYQYSDGGVLKAWNNIIYGFGSGIASEYINTTGTYALYNNTIPNYVDVGIYFQGAAAGVYRWANNLVQGTGGWGNYRTADLAAPGLDYAFNNLSQDATSPNPPAQNKVVSFVNAGAADYHLAAGDPSARNFGIDLSSDPVLPVIFDIDDTIRQVPWDIGADDTSGTTEVRLQSFSATPGDASVVLEWRTASELDNLGFHLYRALSEDGPWTRLTSSLVPGLGSSAVGQAYSWRDSGLHNGTRYYYRLEDVDASSRRTSHGPVSAVPSAAAAGGAPGSEPAANGGARKVSGSSSCPDWVLAAFGSSVGSDAATASLRCTRHGDPEAVGLEILARDAHSVVLELRTGGFYALHTPAGAGEASDGVRVFVPGFDFPQDGQGALPARRALVDAVVGRKVQLGGVRALDLVGFRGLVPSALGQAEMEVSWDGTVRAGRRAVREIERRPVEPRRVSTDLVKLLPSVFQGETKSAVVEISPLRYDARRRQLVLTKRVRLRLLFTGRETGERGQGRFGRREKPQPAPSGEVLARLYTQERGLYAVGFEQLFPGRSRGYAASELRLERQGEAVAFHLEPADSSFGLGSVLYFHTDATPASTDYSSEVAFELRHARGGVVMPLISAMPSGNAVSSAPMGEVAFETNRFYQPGLLDAPDPWLWQALPSGAVRTESFTLAGVDTSAALPAELEVFLQGASESGSPIDHHLSVSLNGVPVGEAQFAGKQPYRMSLAVPVSLLQEGANELSLTNVGDTGVSSMVFLDRFTLAHPHSSWLAGGRLEATWSESATASVAGVSGAMAVVDVTPPSPTSGPSGAAGVSASSGSVGARWLTGYESAGGALRFQAEAGRRYLAVASTALRSPRVVEPQASGLRSAGNQADYLLIAPRSFLAACEPLIRHRRDQGLSTRAVAFEEIADEFGHGEPSAEAIQSFLSSAYQSWARPSPRYVVLVGDSSYDPRNFMGSSPPSPLPALWTKTSYLWTVSDPLLAAVNGEDKLPDLAIGRLPAATVEQAQTLIAKLIAWEDSGQGLNGTAALVADNPDIAGDFEADSEDIRASFFAGRDTRMLKLSELGAATRPAILDALNEGLSYLSYVGHGGAAVWASENVWNSWDAASLLAQSQQPLLVTMNCLNGYFVAPAFESLSESLLKAEGRGAVAAFSPSGLSLDGPAHQYQRALMAELTNGRHARLGDAVLAAQHTYAEAGLMPELLSVYHLMGDPAMRIR